MLNVYYPVLEDSIKELDVSGNKQYYEGEAVTLNNKGQLDKVVENTPVYGIMAVPHNVYRSWVTGEFGAYGSGRARVIKKGIVAVGDEIYETTTGEIITIKLWTDDVETAAPMTPLYLDFSAGYAKFTTVKTPENDKTYVGKVNKSPAITGGVLEITLDL